jgi:hypothetical protein
MSLKAHLNGMICKRFNPMFFLACISLKCDHIFLFRYLSFVINIIGLLLAYEKLILKKKL